MVRGLLLLLVTAVAGAALAQDVNCNVATAVVPTTNIKGEAETTGDIVLTCTGGTAGNPSFIQLTVTLNTNLTSRLLGTTPVTSEALLLIDDPQPDSVNLSNGFSYDGQVLGKPGTPAGLTGSGNVYLGRPSSDTSVSWSGVPFVAPGPSATRTLRITNVRANVTTVPSMFGLYPVNATVTASLPLTNPNPVVAIGATGPLFSYAISPASMATLTFAEFYPEQFRARITNAPGGGPFSMSRQDMPGFVYYTESQFTPCFTYGNCSTPPSSVIGLASTGTLLLARITGLGANAASLSVPNQVAYAETGAEAYLLVAGKPVTATGATSLPVKKGEVEAIYEVTAALAFALETFSIPATLLDSANSPLAFPSGALFAGYVGPLNSTGTASPTAPEPRYIQ